MARKVARPDLKAEAKRLYLQYLSPRQISARLDVPEKTVDSWTRSEDPSWPKQRIALAAQKSVENRAFRIDAVQRLYQVVIPAAHNAVVARLEKGPLTLQEARLCVSMVQDLDKAFRLDIGDPTEIVDNKYQLDPTKLKAATIKDLKEAIEKDDFIDVITEVNDGKKELPKASGPDTSEVQGGSEDDPFK